MLALRNVGSCSTALFFSAKAGLESAKCGVGSDEIESHAVFYALKQTQKRC
jgi:hypothetical protein